jgi:integrase
MACVRKRRDRWVVDYRDSAGTRRWRTFPTRHEATVFHAKCVQWASQPTHPTVSPNVTLTEYAGKYWLPAIAPAVKPRTRDGYAHMLRLHILPALGPVRVRLLHRARIKALLAEKLQSGLARNSVRLIHATLRVLLNAAVDDGIILANPADKLAKTLHLVRTVAARQEEIKALSREQLGAFLTAAVRVAPRLSPLFILLARSGMRLGEALALKWDDLDFTAREIRVARAFSAGRLETPKSGHGRTVDMSRQLARILRRLDVERKAETLRHGWREVPPWVFCSEAGTPLDANNVAKVFKRGLKAAGLPLHFTPHGLRHSFASLLLSAQVSPAYVQRQLGHASIKLTVDTYGRWLPIGNKAAIDGLDDEGVLRIGAADESRPDTAP